MTLACSKCQAPIEFADIGPPRHFNMASVSFAVIEHSQQVECPGCGELTTPMIYGLGEVALVAGIIPRKSNIVKPPPGLII